MLDIDLSKLLELANIANNYLKLRVQDTYVDSATIQQEIKEMEKSLNANGINLDKFISTLKDIDIATFRQSDMNWDYKNEQHVATVYSEDGRCIVAGRASINSDYTLTYKLENNEVVCEVEPVKEDSSLIREYCQCGSKLTLMENHLGAIIQIDQDVKLKSKKYLVCSNPKCGYKTFNQFLTLIDELRTNECVLDADGTNVIGSPTSYDGYDNLNDHRRNLEKRMRDSKTFIEYVKDQGEYFKPNIDKERLRKVLETKLPERTLSRLKQVYDII